VAGGSGAGVFELCRSGFAASLRRRAAQVAVASGGFVKERGTLFRTALRQANGAARLPDRRHPWAPLPHSSQALGLFQATVGAVHVAGLSECRRGRDAKAHRTWSAHLTSGQQAVALDDGIHGCRRARRGLDSQALQPDHEVRCEPVRFGDASPLVQQPVRAPPLSSRKRKLTQPLNRERSASFGADFIVEPVGISEQ